MSLNDKIKKANDILDQFGGKAILVDKTRSGFTSIGYKGGYLLEAANQGIGASNWKHIVHSTDLYESAGKDGKTKINVVTKVSIQILDDDGKVVFESGPQAGGSFIVYGNYGDAIKSSLSDAIGKAFSLLGLGSKAYRGELKASDATSVVKEDGVEEEIAAELTGVTTVKGNQEQVQNTTSPLSSSSPFTTVPRFGGFKTKTNGSAGAPTIDKSSTDAPTARFRSPGLTPKGV